jgi:acyl-CoA reductase-like NAD-dependent aldehyde dehydrogenase
VNVHRASGHKASVGGHRPKGKDRVVKVVAVVKVEATAKLVDHGKVDGIAMTGVAAIEAVSKGRRKSTSKS